MQPDRTYNGVISGASLMTSRNGTPGIQVMIVYEDTDGFTAKTSTTFWMTPKTLPQVKRTLKSLGVEVENLTSETYLDNIGQAMEGTEISFTTVEEEYNGETRVRVQWVNARRDNGSGEHESIARTVARLFGAEYPAPEINKDPDVPF